MNKTICIECNKMFTQQRDLEVCNICIKFFDVDKLWKDHDSNKINALDFNENVTFRNNYHK